MTQTITPNSLKHFYLAPTTFGFLSFLPQYVDLLVPFVGASSFLSSLKVKSDLKLCLWTAFLLPPYSFYELYISPSGNESQSSIPSSNLTSKICNIYQNAYSAFSALPCLKLNPSYTRPALLHVILI